MICDLRQRRASIFLPLEWLSGAMKCREIILVAGHMNHKSLETALQWLNQQRKLQLLIDETDLMLHHTEQVWIDHFHLQCKVQAQWEVASELIVIEKSLRGSSLRWLFYHSSSVILTSIRSWCLTVTSFGTNAETCTRTSINGQSGSIKLSLGWCWMKSTTSRKIHSHLWDKASILKTDWFSHQEDRSRGNRIDLDNAWKVNMVAQTRSLVLFLKCPIYILDLPKIHFRIQEDIRRPVRPCFSTTTWRTTTCARRINVSKNFKLRSGEYEQRLSSFFSKEYVKQNHTEFSFIFNSKI